MPGAEIVKLQVELVEKNAEARLKALDKLAQQMGNRKITLNFDEASLARWKTATDGMTNAQISAYAKLATASENASAKIIAAGQRTTQEEMKQNAKLVTERQKSFDKKVQLYEKEDTKRRQAAEKTAQAEINANAKVQVATLKGVQGTRKQTQAQKELNAEASKTSGIFDSITQRFTAANLISNLITTGISRIRQAFREAVDEMKEMDKELTTIKMVSGASDYEIGQLRDQAFAGARANGRSVTDYLSAAEMFTRAGYRDNIDQLSQLALMTQNIGGVEEEVAGKFLLAADAAWKLGGSYESLMGVLDGVSSVADQNATDLGKIAEGITIAGSAMANAGVSAKEFTAMLGLTTASTQRSGSEMARGLRTILFRVRQVKAEFDDGEVINAEDISNAAKALKEVADIDVIDKQTNDLKSFSEIMSELAGKWVDLDDKQKQYLQNALAGNRQGNVLFAWLENWDAYEKMLQQYEESSGTALQKNAEYTDSWAASTASLKTAWVDFMGTMTANGGALQWITDRLTELIDKSNAFVKDTREAWDFSGLEWDSNAKRFKRVEKDVEDSGKAAKEAAPEIVDYSNAVDEAGENADDAADDVDKLTTAFDKQREKISEVAKAIKEEKDDAVNSLSDIYKAMNEAAENGYYGSNSFNQGGALFFSEEVLDDIRNGRNNPLKDAMDAYIEGIQEGDYSGAAAELFSSITKGANEIKDANGQAIASMKDLGDSFEWTFDKGSLSMDEYLKSLSSSTGISETFWASMIESLGMYSDELAKWTESNGEIEINAEADTEQAEKNIDTVQEKTDNLEDKTITISADTEAAQNNVDTLQEARDKLEDKTITINVRVVQSGAFNTPFSANDDSWIVSEHNTSGTTYGGQTSAPASLLLTGATGGSPWRAEKKAGGKRDNYSGIALVNDEYPANGSKPELIISPSKGTAYIANRGKPALVNLASDDVVLTASETRSALGVPMFPGGKEGSPVTITTPKSSNTKSSKKKTAAEEATDPTENWNQLKKLIDYAIDKEKDVLDDKLAVLDKQLAELESARKSQKNIDALAQKLVNVDEAQLDLLKAQTERTVRYYNESTKQWEWMADQGALAEAENAYETALKDLNDFLVDLNFEEQRANIKAQKDALQEAFDTYKKGWDLIVESIEAPTGDLAALFAELKTNGTEAMKSQAENIQSLLGALEEGFYTSIDDAALANADSLAKTYEMLNASSSDSQARAQEAINNILGRSQQASTETTDAAKLALGDLSSVGSTSITDLMGEAQKSLDSMTTETESTGEGMAKTLSDAAVDIAGTASGAIQDIVKNANDFLNRVKGTDAANKEDGSGKSVGGSGGGSGKSSKGGKKDVIGETTKKTADILTGAKALKTAYSKASTAAESEVQKYTSALVKNVKSNIVNNNGGNTYINGVKIGSDQINRPLASVMSNLNIHTNSDR